METEIILVHLVVRLLSIDIYMTLYSYPDMPINTYYLSFQPLSLFFCDHPTSTSRSPAHLSKDHLIDLYPSTPLFSVHTGSK